MNQRAPNNLRQLRSLAVSNKRRSIFYIVFCMFYSVSFISKYPGIPFKGLRFLTGGATFGWIPWQVGVPFGIIIFMGGMFYLLNANAMQSIINSVDGLLIDSDPDSQKRNLQLLFTHESEMNEEMKGHLYSIGEELI